MKRALWQACALVPVGAAAAFVALHTLNPLAFELAVVSRQRSATSIVRRAVQVYEVYISQGAGLQAVKKSVEGIRAKQERGGMCRTLTILLVVLMSQQR
jgi:hypothetical protein